MEEINEKRALDTLFDLLKIKSPTGNEKEIVGYVQNIFQTLDMDVSIDQCGKKIGSNAGNLIAYYNNPHSNGGEPIFLNAHLDTVSLNGEVAPVLANGRICNKQKDTILGGDDKVAVGTILEALRVIQEKKIPTCPIFLVFTVSEEGGILGAKHLDMESIDAQYGFTFDDGGDVGTIVNRAPYQNTFELDFEGKAAHAGIEPEKGVNAIVMAADYILGLKLGRIDGETTSNVGLINGGTATNVVAQQTRLKMEARSLDPAKLDALSEQFHDRCKKIEQHYKGSVTFSMAREYDGFEINEGELPFLAAKEAIASLGLTPQVRASGGGSDVNIFNAQNKKAVNLSAGMENVHTSEEYIKVDQFYMLTKLVLEICKYKIHQ